MDCIFCKIVGGEIPSKFLYQDDSVVVFNDIHPAAPTHVLIVPRQHIPSLTHVPEAGISLVGHMVAVANKLAKDGGIAESGYRIVINTGKEGGQVVPHLHMHLLGGKRLTNGLG